MTFSFDISDELKLIIKKLEKKDKIRLNILNRKIKEITGNDLNSIDKYKNLKYNLSDYKRVHIDKSFVLLFSIDKNKRHIIFNKLKHHDEVYK